MAGNQVTFTFAGDATSLERAMGSVGTSAKKMAGNLDDTEKKARGLGAGMDRVGEAAGNSESKFIGTADLLDGLGTAFGLPTAGATTLFRAFGDLSGGFEVVQGIFSSGIGKIGEFAKKLDIAGMATKVWTGIQAAFNLVMDANPIILVGAAVVALGAALVIAYQKSETFRNVVQGAFGVVKTAVGDVVGFFEGLPGTIGAIGQKIFDVLTWPYRTAFNFIARAWNATLGGIHLSIPDIPGLPGRGTSFGFPTLHEFHTGGFVGQGLSPGTPIPAMLLAGETVAPIGGGGPGGGGVTVIVQGNVLDGRQLADMVHSALLAKQRRTPLGFAT